MKFLTQAPARDGLAQVAIKITSMSIADARLWHQLIQPASAEAGDADQNWNWPSMRRWLPLTEIALGRRAPAFSVWVESVNGEAIPAGMILLCEGYPSLDNSGAQSIYIWFMAAAPESALLANGIKAIPKLGRVLIDIGVTHSHNCGYHGRIGLHASPQGGDKLLSFYRNAGFTLLPVEAKLPRESRTNDGRYLYFDEHQAKKWSNSLNSCR